MNSRILITLAATVLTVVVVGTGAFAQKKPAPHSHAKAHTAKAKESNFTLREVMQYLTAAQQQVQTGLLMNNRLMIAKGARAIAEHPMPKGGIAPYIRKNHAALKDTIKAMDQQVHSTAVSIAAKAESAPMLELQQLNQNMVMGCVSCHNVFRD